MTDVHAAAFWLPKAGHTADEYEDAYALPDPPQWPYRAAVADGATESSYARAWARRLVHGFVDTADIDAASFGDHLAAWRRTWSQSARSPRAGLPWYAAAKAAEGASATFLGLTLRAEGTWSTLAVGDCCLFQIRRTDVLVRWPLTDPEQFTFRPDLINSRSETGTPEVGALTGTWQPGDAFLLATDALAARLMPDPAPALAYDAVAFAEAVRAGRSDRHLRNDDVTLLVLTLQP